MSASKVNLFVATNHQFWLHNTALLPLSLFWRQQVKPLNNPFPEGLYQLPQNSNAANRSDRYIDHIFMMSTITTTFPAMSRSPLALLNFVDFRLLSSTHNNPFITKAYLSATLNPPQTLYQPHTAPKIDISSSSSSSFSVPIVNPKTLFL